MFRLTVSLFVLCLLSACGRAAAPALTVTPAAPAPVSLSAAGEGQGADIAVTRIAHASVLLEMGGKRILTDPWFSETNAYRHGEPLGIALEDLPKLDLVIASHGHYDHFDIETFAAYPDKAVPMVVGPDMVEKARAAGFTNVQELKPWESAQIGDITVTACPGSHGVDEVTFMLQAHGSTVYFGGDSRLIPEMDELPNRFPSVQLALLSVNGLHAMGKQMVMSAEEAAQLAGKLHAEVAVPFHYRFQGNWFTETFILRYEGSPERFTEAAQVSAPSTQVRVLSPGERLLIAREQHVADHQQRQRVLRIQEALDEPGLLLLAELVLLEALAIVMAHGDDQRGLGCVQLVECLLIGDGGVPADGHHLRFEATRLDEAYDNSLSFSISPSAISR